MSVIGHSPLAGASGAAGGADPLYVDDVFSTFLYVGNNTAGKNIINGIDLSGEGGMVWIKRRETAGNHVLYDTERGATKSLYSAETDAENTRTGGLTSFNSNGFTLGGFSYENRNGESHVSWTFRKAPGFFDVVTYSGTGSAQNISHSLGSVPGMIMIHCRTGSHDWEVYHRVIGATKSIHLNKTDTPATDSTVWNNTTPTSSVFTVGTSSNVNQNGHGYVAYVFAHDEQAFGANEDQAIIKCGNYTGNGNTNGPSVDLGFEPQWLLIKRTGDTADWCLFDNMRGIGAPGVNDKFLAANTNNAESTGSRVGIYSTGFQLTTSSGIVNGNGSAYIYMAIRRPHKPPTAGTEVFAATEDTTATTLKSINIGFPTDFAIQAVTESGGSKYAYSRLAGNSWLETNSTSAESAGDASFYVKFDQQNTFTTRISDQDNVFYNFRRAPGFFDTVGFIGTGSAKTVDHNLGAVPELIIVKNRGYSFGWAVYAQAFGRTKYLYLHSSDSIYTASAGTFWGTSEFTSTQFFLGNYGNTNLNTYKHIAYLFASLDGISKIGTYSGTGSNVNVDCGFTSGARFILIKRTDNTGDWYAWDSTRGIVSGNDPYLLLNSTAAEVTNTDYVDPLNAGFTVTSSAPAALNASGGTYLFLAIA